MGWRHYDSSSCSFFLHNIFAIHFTPVCSKLLMLANNVCLAVRRRCVCEKYASKPSHSLLASSWFYCIYCSKSAVNRHFVSSYTKLIMRLIFFLCIKKCSFVPFFIKCHHHSFIPEPTSPCIVCVCTFHLFLFVITV